MADTINDVAISKTSYVDVNTLSGLVAGTALIIINKSPSVMLVQTSAAQPSDDDTNGVPLYSGQHPTSIKFVTAGESTLWAKYSGHVTGTLSVQDNS